MQEMTMVERVARALCIADKENPDTVTPYNPNVEKLWQYYIPDAVAAIEAMRTPTNAMIAEGNAHDDRAPYDIYESMIDAALSE